MYLQYKRFTALLIILTLIILPGYVLSEEPGNIWLGKLPKPPAPEECGAGMIFYDTTLLKLRKSLNSPCTNWTQFPGESAYAQFVTVSGTGKADFTVDAYGARCIQEAINSFKNCSEDTRGAVIILPGNYDIGKKSLKCIDYVDLVGADKDSCKITGVGKTVVNVSDNSGIINLTIENTGKSSKTTVVSCIKISYFSYLSDCSVTGNGNAIELNNSSSYNITNCSITSLKKYGISCKKSNPTVFNSKISGKSFALKCLKSSTATFYNSTVKGIYISKNSKIELTNTNTDKSLIDGGKGAILVSNDKSSDLNVSDNVKIRKPHDIQKKLSRHIPKRSTSTPARYADNPKRQGKKDCGCKKKESVAIIEVDEVYKKIRKRKTNVVLIDVRSEDEFMKRHIKKAINIPYKKITENLPDRLPRDKEIIFYCSRSISPVSEYAVRRLLDMGYKKVVNMKGGFEEWKKKKYPLVPKKPYKSREKKKQ